jgi:hypothetical protein
MGDREPCHAPGPEPVAGATDRNDERAIEGAGVLFMEGQGEPAEIARIKAELRTTAETGEQTCTWLAGAMEASWNVAEALLPFHELADLLGERHRIIANNWQNATNGQLIAKHLHRAVTVIEQVDFSPAGLRADLSGRRTAPSYLYTAAELINHAADLSASGSILVHENERRWRTFSKRLAQITSAQSDGDRRSTMGERSGR